jgi:hypothetical protein
MALIVLPTRPHFKITGACHVSDADHNCWICGTPGATGEHMIKKSDLKSEFRSVTQQAPLYFHRKGSRSKPIGSFDAKLLKYPILCEECNTSRTQRHDRAWKELSTFLGTRKPEPGTTVRANCIFPDSTPQEMLNVHLYFVKRFGCEIIEAGAPIDIRAFSNAILDGTWHPHLYLRVGRIAPFPEGKQTAGFDKVREVKHPDGSSVFCWLYGIGCMSVQVLHAINVALLPLGAWHPRTGTDSLVIAKFPGS